jgi:hypothetical protein
VREQGGVEITTRGFIGHIILFQSCPSCPEDRLTSYYSGVYDPTDSNSTDVQFIMNYSTHNTDTHSTTGHTTLIHTQLQYTILIHTQLQDTQH